MKQFYGIIACFFLLLTFGCRKTDSFTVRGEVAGASGQTLYLEHTGESATITLDSIKIKVDGTFFFQRKQTDYPEFYRLNLNNQRIHFVVDSTETITLVADAHNFATSYTIEGSENSKSIKEIALALLDADQEIKKLRNTYDLNLIPDSTYEESFLNAIKHYKEIALKYIFGAPGSPTAYFALFQQIDGHLIFDLYDRTDSKAYGAVATSYNILYPESPRTKQLVQWALLSQSVTRGERKNQFDLSQAKEIYYIDIELPDIYDKKIALSAVAQNKVVLVNFTIYQQEWSPRFNRQLFEVYQKYHSRGFEIYQISLDNDAHFWKNIAVNLPWVSVRDPNSVYSSIAAIYDVKRLPTLFLINKKGDGIKRIESIETLEAEVKLAL